MKTPDGTYDALPFIDLREYGNTDYQQWLHLDQEIEIPLTPNNPQYQVMCPPLRCLIFIIRFLHSLPVFPNVTKEITHVLMSLLFSFHEAEVLLKYHQPHETEPLKIQTKPLLRKPGLGRVCKPRNAEEYKPYYRHCLRGLFFFLSISR